MAGLCPGHPRRDISVSCEAARRSAIGSIWRLVARVSARVRDMNFSIDCRRIPAISVTARRGWPGRARPGRGWQFSRFVHAVVFLKAPIGRVSKDGPSRNLAFHPLRILRDARCAGPQDEGA
jgi:hypothetical protein